MSEEKPIDENTSSILHKQDCFWEEIIFRCEQELESLKTEEDEMQKYVLELKTLVQAISAFQMSKLVNSNINAAVNELCPMRCICPTSVPKDRAIKVDTCTFGLDAENIREMSIIKDLVQHEQNLVSEINMLRVKDYTLTDLKQKVDKLMKQNIPNTDFPATNDTMSNISAQIITLLKEVRTLSDELSRIKKENKISFQLLHETIPKEILHIKKLNSSLENQIIDLNQELTDISLRETDLNKDALRKQCAVQDMKNVIAFTENQIDILEKLVEEMQNIA